jgi:two-component system response regulator WspF
MRIGIVNDVQMAVEALRRVVASAADHDVAWVAFDGAEAAARCREDTPDVVLMDLIMPNVNGVEATRRIMRDSPCAILVVTASVEQNSSLVFDAMGQGALDAVNTPVLDRHGIHGGHELLAKLATIGKLLHRSGQSQPVVRSAVPRDSTSAPVIAIGASTGGPLAVVTVLRALPRDLAATTVIIQHVDVQFAAGLRHWLEDESGRRVSLVNAGAVVGGPDILLAGTNDHLVLCPDASLAYVAEPVDCPYRPSVDVFFASVVAHWSGPAIGVLLTGMGRDGAEGLLAMRRAGWATIAQDRETSVVYGMPKAAADIGAAAEVLPIDAVAPAILRALGSTSRSKEQST